jgi:hypothetical protein
MFQEGRSKPGICAKLLLAVLLLIFLASCYKGPQAPVLELETYSDPAGRFQLSIPQGWQASTEGETLCLTPPDYDPDNPGHLRVLIALLIAEHEDPELQMEASKALLEAFLHKYLDPEFQSINEGETKLARYPAMLIDFGKPWQDSYLTGRQVIAPLPIGSLVILGSGSEANWKAFLPTFKQMLRDFKFTGSLLPEPIIP